MQPKATKLREKMSFDLLSSSNQIKPKNYTTKIRYNRQDVTPEMEDAMEILAERNNVSEYLHEGSVWAYQFFFYVHIKYEGFPANEDSHHNVVITKVLDWYMNGPSKEKITELFDGNDVMRISIQRLFSFYSTKHTFSITIISLKNHEGDWGELKHQLCNPNEDEVCVIDAKSSITIRGEYPIDTPDQNEKHNIES
jgi:hypothetical protein